MKQMKLIWSEIVCERCGKSIGWLQVEKGTILRSLCRDCF